MRDNIKKHYLLALLFVLTLTFTMNAESVVMRPTLYGKVLHSIPSGLVHLGKTVVELLSPDTGEVRFTTYTDYSGYYAFYDIPPGQYDLQIVFGKEVMEQLTEDGAIERRRIEVLGQGIRIPDITVRSK